MCFSPTASFIAGTVLIGTGVTAVVKTRDRRYLPFALTPVLFGVQQLCEGIVWLVLLGRLDLPIWLPTVGFVFFAYLFWPVYAPWAVLQVEPHPKRRTWITGALILGGLVSLYTLVMLVANGVTPVILHQSIGYETIIPAGALTLTLYVIAVCGGALFSSHRPIVWISLLTLLSLAATRIFYETTLVSVWCFFAALLSFAWLWFVLRAPKIS